MCSEMLPSRSASASGRSSKSDSLSPLGLRQLRPYQREVALAILDSVFKRKGLTFSVEIARQGGKNELSAQLELLLLTLYIPEPQNLIKCSPTFKPQTVISMMRLIDRLNDAGYSRLWNSELGYIIRLGNARAIFLSADESANVVGNTAHILLEIDESQDVSKDKYTKDFKPMGATTNVTTVHYGTTWDETTLLEEIKQTNLELEKKDGIRRHFHYDWQDVAKFNPDYQAYVEAERQRLGENHPLFLTQYCLLPIRGGGGFLSAQQKAQLQGNHPRKHAPENGRVYVAGIDLAGEAEEADDARLRSMKPYQDSTVITIGELDFAVVNELQKQPAVRIVEHYWWTGKKHTELYPRLVDILKHVWGCKKVVVDATGIGQPVASFLKQAIGSKIIPFTFTAPSKSKLGFDLLAAVNSGRLKMYSSDGSHESQEFHAEIEKAKSRYRPNQTMNFFVEPSKGHDDFLMSLALVVEAANNYEPREAKGKPS
ncbi:MAG: hypothetical protein PHY28_01965 [Dehalococcoidales bacterium]|nr:hypothetical protein [Dehalococcoidales bacterium]